MNEVTKKLGRPKIKAKNPEAGTLLHVVLSAQDKARLEQMRLYHRCEAYAVAKHGATPSALPRINNATLISVVLDNVYYMTMTNPETLEALLTLKGCQNAAELLGIGGGADK